MSCCNLILIDDDPVALFLYSEILKHYKFPVSPTSFTNAKEAIKHLKELDNDAPIIILLDLNMPIMDGWTFLDSIKEIAPDKRMHVFILSSSVNRSDQVRAKSYEMVCDYFEKPLTEVAILKMLACL